MLHITLGDRRPVDPVEDELGRNHVGFAADMSQADLYAVNRGCWVLGERADTERYALFSYKGIVRMALAIDAIEPTSSNRRALVGRILQPGDRVHDVYVGGPAPIVGARNPITYVPDPRFDLRVCSCGCGEPIPRGDWVPGHDQKALHKRIAQIGTVKQFIEWFDANAPQAARAGH
ncbi:hypothetical protein [Vallicoccus soli]|uniref:Uncharacterized protein n=1 Tax=Vallicoccus soli TaxID=2339232 RepID=A0A3A3YS75_9ACTN|nr:hypothetical protein [Vallicoccus soli]RJK92521.1 hypothetical protein D5H78_18765 [Vallicoccus soli]